MEHRDLKRLVQLMNDNGLIEVEIEREGSRVHLRKAGAVQAHAIPAMPMAAPVAQPGVPAPAPAGQTPAEPEGPPEGVEEIVSPMVGTFYRRPSPDSDPYVAVGDRIDGESVVCILEAMKVNNELKAEKSGTITEILVEDGAPVEFGQPLFRVKVA